MYLDHFGLVANPFSLSPKTDFVFRSDTFDENMAHLVYGLDNSEAIILITGPIGSGKTLAIQSFLSHLGPQFLSALVTNTQVNSLELLKLILEDLGVTLPRGCDKSDLLILLKEFLFKENKRGCRIVIVIDEAQNLAPDALEEIRLLTNIGQGDSQPIQIILVGQPELEDRVDSPSLVQLRQRIRVHYRLAPLQPNEVEGYLNHRMKVAGCETLVFRPKAAARIFLHSEGIPRLVNTLASAALLAAYIDDRKVVEEKDIDPADAGFLKGAPVGGNEHQKPIEKVIIPKPAAPIVDIGKPVEKVAQNIAPKADQVKRVHKTRKSRIPVWAIVAFILILVPVALYFNGNLDEFLAKTKLGNPGPVAVRSGSEPQADNAAAGTKPKYVASINQGIPSVPPKSSGETLTAQKTGESIYLHVASFQKEKDADYYASTLEKSHYASRVKHHLVSNKNWYRVYIGPFNTEESASTEGEKLKAGKGLKYYKVVRLNEAMG